MQDAPKVDLDTLGSLALAFTMAMGDYAMEHPDVAQAAYGRISPDDKDILGQMAAYEGAGNTPPPEHQIWRTEIMFNAFKEVVEDKTLRGFVPAGARRPGVSESMQARAPGTAGAWARTRLHAVPSSGNT